MPKTHKGLNIVNENYLGGPKSLFNRKEHKD